jgi:drug/metabolite transporter (DMT)-like permease
MNNRQQLLGAGSIVFATVIYGFFSILARFIGFNLPIFFQNWTREIVASAILLALLFVTKQTLKHMTTRDFLWVLARAVAGSTAYLLYFYCINTMPIGTTYFLFYGGSSIIGYLLGKLLFNEHMTVTKWVAMCIAICGLLLVYSINFQHTSILYILMALGAGAGTAFWNIAPKKIQIYPTIQLVFLDNLLPIPFYLLLSLITREPWSMPTLTPVWIASLFYGVLFVITGQLVIYGFNRLEAQIGTILMLGEIPLAILLGFLFYKETITPTTLIGGMLIIVAMIIPELHIQMKNVKTYKRKQQPAKKLH